MIYEKIAYDTYNIRLQHNNTCYVFGLDGQYIQIESIYEQGSLLEVGCISVLKMLDRLEVASDVNGQFKIQQLHEVGVFNDLDTHLRAIVGIKYRLVRNITTNCTQYLYIYHKGILDM